MYSPSCRDTAHRPQRTSTPCRVLRQSQISFSDSEVSGSRSPHSSSHLFKKSFDYISNGETSVPLRRTTGIRILPPHPNQILTKFGKSSGSVLTSQENLLLLAEKEETGSSSEEGRKKEREERKFQREQLESKKDQFLAPMCWDILQDAGHLHTTAIYVLIVG